MRAPAGGRITAILAVSVAGATFVPGCLSSINCCHYEETLRLTLDPGPNLAAFSVSLPVLFDENQTNSDFDPQGVAASMQALTVTAGLAHFEFQGNGTYWRLLLVNGTGPVTLSSNRRVDSADLRGTEDYLRWGWTTGRDRDRDRGSRSPAEVLVGVRAVAGGPLSLTLHIDRTARSDYAWLEFHANGTASDLASDGGSWAWISATSSGAIQ